MKRLYQWVREFFKRVGRWIYARIIDTKFMYLIVGICIGGSVMFIKLEAPAYYKWAVEGVKITEISIANAKESNDVSRELTKEEDAANADTPSKIDGDLVISLVDYIHGKESTHGKANYSKCAAMGKFNEYGFGIPGNGTYRCFEKGEDTKAVEAWVKEKLSLGFTEKELLCVYNTGTKSINCNYAQNYEK